MNWKQLLQNFSPSCEQESEDLRMMLTYAGKFDDILFRSNEIAHFTSSSWIVNAKHTHILMIYHNIYDSWAWTGGHADGESDLLGIALREAQEETGITNLRPLSEDIFSVEILTVAGHIKRGKYVVPHLHLNTTFLLEAPDDQQLRHKPDENSGVAWFPIEDVVKASSEPEMRKIYKKLNDRLATFLG